MTKYKQDKELYRCEWFTTFIKRILGEKKLTVEKLAEMMGLSESTVMSWVTGTRSPGLKTFILLLETLDLDLIITEKR